MNLKVSIDPLALFFEQHGHYLQPRQLVFCRCMLATGDQCKSAKKAGFVNPDSDGATLYSMYRVVLTKYREAENLDYELVVNAYRRAAVATEQVCTIKANPAAGIPAEFEDVPNYRVQKDGADGLCKVFGFNAAVESKVDLTARAELPATLREKLDNAYKPHGS